MTRGQAYWLIVIVGAILLVITWSFVLSPALDKYQARWLQTEYDEAATKCLKSEDQMAYLHCIQQLQNRFGHY